MRSVCKTLEGRSFSFVVMDAPNVKLADFSEVLEAAQVGWEGFEGRGVRGDGFWPVQGGHHLNNCVVQLTSFRCLCSWSSPRGGEVVWGWCKVLSGLQSSPAPDAPLLAAHRLHGICGAAAGGRPPAVRNARAGARAQRGGGAWLCELG